MILIVGMVWNFAELQSIMQLSVATLCCCISFFRTIATSVAIILSGPKSYCNCMLIFRMHRYAYIKTLVYHTVYTAFACRNNQKLHTHAITSLNCLVNHCFDVRNNVSTCYKFLISKHRFTTQLQWPFGWFFKPRCSIL